MIEIGKHLCLENGEYTLRFSKDEMKGNREHTPALPAHVTANIDEFVSRYRPKLSGSDGPYFFPGKGPSKPKHDSTIRDEYERITLKYLGRKINPHSIRHITSQYCINKDESSIFDVSRRLGHASIETTREFYLSSDTNKASRALNKMLDGDDNLDEPTQPSRKGKRK
jgi:integrase